MPLLWDKDINFQDAKQPKSAWSVSELSIPVVQLYIGYGNDSRQSGPFGDFAHRPALSALDASLPFQSLGDYVLAVTPNGLAHPESLQAKIIVDRDLDLLFGSQIAFRGLDGRGLAGI